MYKVLATYTYEFDGKPYRGQRVSLYTGSDGNAEHHFVVEAELKAHLQNGRPFRAFVNPTNPAESVLYRDWRWNVSRMHLFYTLLFGGMGAFLVASSLYYWRKQQREG